MVVLSSVPLWTNVHPAVSVLSLLIGVALVVVEPEAVANRPTFWSWLLRLAGLGLAVSAVSIWLESTPILATPLFVAGLA